MCVAATAGVHAGSKGKKKKPQRAATVVWTTAVHFSKSFTCNHCAGQRVSSERDEKGDLSEENANMISRLLNSI